jgi:hypothetical protein
MIKSCLKLSATLLELYTPEGDKRKSSTREDDFADDLADYFEAAKCTGKFAIFFPFTEWRLQICAHNNKKIRFWGCIFLGVYQSAYGASLY